MSVKPRSQCGTCVVMWMSWHLVVLPSQLILVPPAHCHDSDEIKTSLILWHRCHDTTVNSTLVAVGKTIVSYCHCTWQCWLCSTAFRRILVSDMYIKDCHPNFDFVMFVSGYKNKKSGCIFSLEHYQRYLYLWDNSLLIIINQYLFIHSNGIFCLLTILALGFM